MPAFLTSYVYGVSWSSLLLESTDFIIGQIRPCNNLSGYVLYNLNTIIEVSRYNKVNQHKVNQLGCLNLKL